MGIPGVYGRFFSKAVRRAIYRGLPPFVSSFAFDLNGAIHDALNQALEIGGDVLSLLKQKLAEIILRMVGAAKPLDCLILAVDGLAPGAKLAQQRSRRFRSS